MRWIILLCVVLMAQAAATERVRLKGYGTVDWEHVGEVRSAAGEDLHAFVVRAAALARDYTDRTTFEACGSIGQRNGAYSVRLNSNRAHMFCANDQTDVGEGFAFTGLTLHSHPKGFFKRANHNDAVFLGVRSVIGANGRRTQGFSDEDYNSGPGFLVEGNGVVQYQQGRGSVQTIGQVYSGGVDVVVVH